VLAVVGFAFIVLAVNMGFKLAWAAWLAFRHPEVVYAITDPQYVSFALLILLLTCGSGFAFIAAAWTVHWRHWKLMAWSLGTGLATAFGLLYLLNSAVLVTRTQTPIFF
jgi:hypothetical protein